MDLVVTGAGPGEVAVLLDDLILSKVSQHLARWPVNDNGGGDEPLRPDDPAQFVRHVLA